MSSPAVSFQGSTLHIGTGSGSAITITSITKAFRAEVTGTNTLAKGDRVTMASVGGMTQLNGNTYNVLSATSSAFVLDVDSRAFTTYTSGGTATPVTWTKVAGVKSINFEPEETEEEDVSDLDSEAKEYVQLLPGSFRVSGEMTISIADPGQTAMRARRADSTLASFKVTLASGSTRTMTAYVKNLPESGGTNSTFKGSYSLRGTGAMSEWA